MRPWLDGIGIDAEDSLALSRLGVSTTVAEPGSLLDVAAVRLPRISNFTDLEALAVEPRVRLRLVDRPGDLGSPDLIVLPGSKSTVADLAWLQATGLSDLVAAAARRRATTVLGLCGGYQMLWVRVRDEVEARRPADVVGLGLLPVTTTFHRTR